MNPTPEAEKVVVVGGGMSGLTTALYLTDPAVAGRYEVTVYTMGWRLGGKGASGRDMAVNGRILEHGLHIWFGLYHNAIATMRRCYAELGRPPGAPLATFDDAFKGQNRFVFTEKVAGEWRQWPVDFPVVTALPGEPSVYDLLLRLIGWLHGKIGEVDALRWMRLADHPGSIRGGAEAIGGLTGGFGLGDQNARHLLEFLMSQISLIRFGGGNIVSQGFKILARLLWAIVKPSIDHGDEARRIWILAYLGITAARGIIDDDLIDVGFDDINGIELRAWMRRHSSFTDADGPLPDDLALESAVMQALYDASFSYNGGDVAKPDIAAGVGIECILRILFDFSGSIVLEMQAGMGDTIFVPLYQVLQRRGVKFAFFHRLTDMVVDPAGPRIGQLTFSRQVALKTPPLYDPLVRVRDLDCWPASPLFEQIVDGDRLRTSGANLEHWNSGWTDTGGSSTLQADVDFTHVVLAISYDVLPFVTGALNINAAWQTMVGALETAPTQAAQLWFAASRERLGMTGAPEIFGGFVEPWSSLTDFSHLLARENWPAGNTPAYLCYTCGPLQRTAPPDGDVIVGDRVRAFLNADAGALWPNAATQWGFDYDVLWSPVGVVGADRLNHQYWRANNDPTETYVIAGTGTPHLRLPPDGTGFGNLVIAGEWVQNGFGISSIEGTVMSGMRASRAICGYPRAVAGEPATKRRGAITNAGS